MTVVGPCRVCHGSGYLLYTDSKGNRVVCSWCQGRGTEVVGPDQDDPQGKPEPPKESQE